MHDRELQYVLASDPNHRVEAFQITKERHLPLQWERSTTPRWLFNALYRAPELRGSVFTHEGKLWVHAPDGHTIVDVDDWLVFDKGHILVCTSVMFHEMFRPRVVNYRFQKRPIIIEAFQMTPGRFRDERDWPTWLIAARDLAPNDMGAFDYDKATDEYLIRTLEGAMRVDDGDWIIRGVHGELYPCKPEIFELTYKEVKTCTESD